LGSIKGVLWAAVIANMAVIFLFSAQPAEQSEKLSRSVTRKIVDTLTEADQNTVEDANAPIRKYAHFLLYLSLGLLTTLAIERTVPQKRIAVVWAAALALCLLYAVSDEAHQLFVAGRGGKALDVLIDGGGSLAGSGAVVARRIFAAKIKF
jgi:VanZ family protein